MFFATQYDSSLSSFVPNIRILTQVVAVKSLTEKSLQTVRQRNKHTYRQTNTITEKAKTKYPLYTSYRGYKNTVIAYSHVHIQVSMQYRVTLGSPTERHSNGVLLACR